MSTEHEGSVRAVLLLSKGRSKWPKSQSLRLDELHLGRANRLDVPVVGDYDAAIELCQRAASQGWAGDWNKHLKRVAGRKVLIKTLSAVRGGLAIAPDDSILAAVALSDRSWILQKKMVAAREESVNQLVPEIRRLLDQAIELVRQMEGFARAEAEQIERNDGGADDLWANVDLFRTLGFDLYFLDRRFETAEIHPSIAILADDADVLASQ